MELNPIEGITQLNKQLFWPLIRMRGIDMTDNLSDKIESFLAFGINILVETDLSISLKD
jgi:hypothetical protein